MELTEHTNRGLNIVKMFDFVTAIFIILIFYLIFFNSSAHATGIPGVECYADAGVMAHRKADSWQEVDYSPDGVVKEIAVIKNPIGTAEIGCSYKRVSVFAYHSTSFQAEDTGINGIGVKYRLFGQAVSD